MVVYFQIVCVNIESNWAMSIHSDNLGRRIIVFILHCLHEEVLVWLTMILPVIFRIKLITLLVWYYHFQLLIYSFIDLSTANLLTGWMTHLLTISLTHFTYSFICLFHLIHSFIHSVHLYIHLFIHSFIYLFIHLFIHLFIRYSFIYSSFIHLFVIQSFIYSIIHSFIHSFRLKCPAGHYCTSGTKTQYQLPCPAGKYSRELGLERADQCKECLIGYYCPQGDGYGDRLCPPGYYCGANVGDYSTTPCPAGTFQEEQGSRCKFTVNTL